MNPRVLHSTEAEVYSSLLNRECYKMTQDPNLQISSPADRGHVARRFNKNDFFHEILIRFDVVTGKEDRSVEDNCAVFLGVNAMVLGVKINKNDMETLRSDIKRVEMSPEDKRQIETAFEHYESNGEEWNFDGGYSSSKATSSADRSTPSEEMKKEDLKLRNEKLAKEGGSGDQGELGSGENDEENEGDKEDKEDA